MADGDTIKTAKLLDEERNIIVGRRALLGRIALEIEQIFLREDLTMGELSEVMDLFNARAQAVFSKTKIKSIKESYER